MISSFLDGLELYETSKKDSKTWKKNIVNLEDLRLNKSLTFPARQIYVVTTYTPCQ